VALNRSRQILATLETMVEEGDRPALTAYQRLHKLPGYQLEGRHIIRTKDGDETVNQISTTYDENGNSHTVRHGAAGQTDESYLVGGRLYYFDPQQQIWVEAENASGDYGNIDYQFPFHWLGQMGIIPTATGQDTIAQRPATRYSLRSIMSELMGAVGQPDAAPTSRLQGTLWVDEETGALLKSELLLFENGSSQPIQEFALEVVKVGDIAPIEAPSSAASPGAAIAATATAQAWSAVQVTLNLRDQDQPTTFALIPVEIRQLNPGLASLQIILQQLPANVLVSPELDSFLDELEKRLTLSIPQNNLTTASMQYQLEEVDPIQTRLTVRYSFNADLDNFDHVELIITGSGNPIFAPVPVADR
jgi:hypothetical protein